jgi:hypothetical protein
MVPAGKAIHAHQKDVTNEKLLLPKLTAFAQSTISIHASRNARCFQHVSSVAPTNSSSAVFFIVKTIPAKRQTRPKLHLPASSFCAYTLTGLFSAFKGLIIYTWPLQMINTNIQDVNHNSTLQSATVINLFFLRHSPRRIVLNTRTYVREIEAWPDEES